MTPQTTSPDDRDAQPQGAAQATEPSGESDAQAKQPALRIIKGNPGPEELAALVGVLASMGGAPEAPKPPVSQWSAPSRRLRSTFPAGHGGWRASGLPR